MKSPKLCLNNTGLLTHLLWFSKDRLGSDPKQGGPLMENLVVMELRKQALRSKMQAELFHFPTQAGCEVDIVLEDRPGRIVGSTEASYSIWARYDRVGLAQSRAAH